MKKLILFSIAAAMIFGSCSSDDNNNNNRKQRIILSSQVTLNNLQRDVEMIRANQSLSLFVTPESIPAEVLYSNVRLTADGAGGFTYGEEMFYPLDGRNVDFYAIHPYIPGSILGAVQSFNVSDQQQIESNYLNSDLLHATRTGVARTSEAVSLTFSHKLSKIDFIIRSTNGLDLSALNNVEILNSYPLTTVSPISGEITPAAGTPVNIRAYGASGFTGPTTEVRGITAIVVPQTLVAGNQLFRITVGNLPYIYTRPANEANIDLAEGFRYTMTLTLTPAGITLTSTVNPWEDGGSIGNGTAEPQ